MKTHSRAMIGVLVAVGSQLAALSLALAGCINAVCAEGSNDGLKRTATIYLTNQISGTTNYNIIPPGGQQFELHINHFSFDVQPGRVYTYSVQACKKGGALQSSTCTQWAQFHHTVD